MTMPNANCQLPSGYEMDSKTIFEQASHVTGRTPEELRQMSERIFASILLHSMQLNGSPLWTVSRIIDGSLEIEVDYPPRLRRLG